MFHLPRPPLYVSLKYADRLTSGQLGNVANTFAAAPFV
jgi:hypothetical protein